MIFYYILRNYIRAYYIKIEKAIHHAYVELIIPKTSEIFEEISENIFDVLCDKIDR